MDVYLSVYGWVGYTVFVPLMILDYAEQSTWVTRILGSEIITITKRSILPNAATGSSGMSSNKL